MKKFAIIITTVLSIFLSAVISASCDIPTNLFKERMNLKKRYEKEIGNDYLRNKEKADLYIKQIKEIDSRYRDVIYSLLYEAELNENKIFSECCNNVNEDKILFFVCNLIEYKITKDKEKFLNYVPSDKKSLEPLWILDAIIFSDPLYGKKTNPKFFDDDSFPKIFIDTVYILATNDDSKALGLDQQIGL